MKVSVLLLTFNEERNLPRCLSALKWCDDVVVVDSGSTDATLDIARSAGARIVCRPFDSFASQRNFGVERGTPAHEWVLHLDADEVVTEEFVRKLDMLKPADDVGAYRIPSKLMLHGQWIKHAGMYPAYQVRLGHRQRMRFKQVGHGQREDIQGFRVETFDVPYLHYNFSHGIATWFQKHLRYAQDEAVLLGAADDAKAAGASRIVGSSGTDRRRRLKKLAGHLPFYLRPLARFLYVYIWKRGFLDGRIGLQYALMLSVYEGMIAVLQADAASLFRAGKAIESQRESPRGGE